MDCYCENIDAVMVVVGGVTYCDTIETVAPSCTTISCPTGYTLIDGVCQLDSEGTNLCLEGGVYDPLTETCTYTESTPATCLCTADVIASPQTICSGDETNIILTSTSPGITYNWTVVQGGVTGASSGSGNVISQVLTGSGSATYIVTPSEIANGCQGTPINVLVTVKTGTNLVATPSTPQNIESGDIVNIGLSSSTPGTTFSWTVTADAGITGATAGTGTTITNTLTATSSGSVVYSIVATSSNGCSNTLEYTVNVEAAIVECLTGFVIETLYLHTQEDLDALPVDYIYPGTFAANAHVCNGALTEITGNSIFLGESNLNNNNGALTGGQTDQGTFICGDYDNLPTVLNPSYTWNGNSRYSKITITPEQAVLLAASAPVGTTNVTFQMTYAVTKYADGCDNAHGNLTWLRLSTAGGTILYNGLPSGNFATIDVCNQPA